MAKMTGKAGSVTFASGIVVNVRSWEITESADIRDATTFADTAARTFVTSGKYAFSGSFERIVDDSDTNVINRAGTTGSATFTLESGMTVTGSIIVQSAAVSVPHDDLIVETITFQGSGALTKANV